MKNGRQERKRRKITRKEQTPALRAWRQSPLLPLLRLFQDVKLRSLLPRLPYPPTRCRISSVCRAPLQSTRCRAPSNPPPCASHRTTAGTSLRHLSPPLQTEFDPLATKPERHRTRPPELDRQPTMGGSQRRHPSLLRFPPSQSQLLLMTTSDDSRSGGLPRNRHAYSTPVREKRGGPRQLGIDRNAVEKSPRLEAKLSQAVVPSPSPHGFLSTFWFISPA